MNKSVKRKNVFSEDDTHSNIVDAMRRVTKTLIINEKIRFPDFEVVTGISREYVASVQVEHKVEKFDAGMVGNFFNSGSYLGFYEDQFAEHFEDMRKCYSYMQYLKIDNLDVFDDFSNKRQLNEDPGIMWILPLIGYFGKLAFRADQVGPYGLTALEKIVVCQILSANSSDVYGKMMLIEEEYNLIKDHFTMYVPPLFVRKCPSTLPIMHLPEIIEKINRVNEKREKREQILVIDSREEEERMEIVITSPLESEESVVSASVVEDYMMMGRKYSEDENEIIVTESKKDYYAPECCHKIQKINMFRYKFVEYKTVLNSDIWNIVFFKFDAKSRVVLSRVSKQWYMVVRNCMPKKFKNDSGIIKVKQTATALGMRSLLSKYGMDLESNNFNRMIIQFISIYVHNVIDFSEFCLTYAVKMTSGVFLLMAVMYVKTMKLYYVGDSLDYCGLEQLFSGMNTEVKGYVKRKIKIGPVRNTGVLFQSSRKQFTYEGIAYVPKRRGKDYVWNGYESVRTTKFKNISLRYGDDELIAFQECGKNSSYALDRKLYDNRFFSKAITGIHDSAKDQCKKIICKMRDKY